MVSENRISDRQYERMTQTPVHKLILTLGLPTTISMLVTNIYNMADTYFVSTLGTSASGAVGIVFALMAVIQAFGFMFGQGAGSCLSRRLGKKQLDEARAYSSAGFYLSLLCGLLIALLGFLFLTPLMRLMGSTDSILPYAKVYCSYILIAAPAMAAGCVMNNILRYEGKAFYAMVGLTSGGILNIFGDFLLIRILDLGIAGAAISTAVSQYISFFILLLPFLRKKTQTGLRIKYLRKDIPLIRDITATGFPSLIRQGLTSVSVMTLNQCSQPYGDAVIAAMGIVSRVMNFLSCLAIGIGQGFQPVSAFNYGAGKYDRVKEAWRFTWLFSTAVLTAAAIAGFLFSGSIITVFRDDPEVISAGIPALRLQCLSLIFMPLSISANMLFQTIGKSAQAIFLSSTRSGLFFIPILLVASHFAGLTGIQAAQALADFISAVVAVPFLVSFFRKLGKMQTTSS